MPFPTLFYFRSILYFFVYIDLTYASLVMNLYNVPSSLCQNNDGIDSKATYFEPSRGPPSQVTVDTSNGNLVAHYPGYTTKSYGYEGTRYYNNTQCSFCPYSSSPPEVLKTEYLLSGGIRLLPTPMYGPCFDGASSTKMNCVQVFLHPKTLFFTS